MQDNSNGGKEYTVDEILKEYEEKSAEDTSEENLPEEEHTQPSVRSWSADAAPESDTSDAVPSDEISEAFELMDNTRQAIKDEGIVQELAEEPVTEEERAAAQDISEEITEIFDDEEQSPAEESEDNTDEQEEDEQEDTESDAEEDNTEGSADEEDTESDTEDNTEDNPEPHADVKEDKKDGFWAGIIPMKGDSILEIIRKIIFIVAVCVFVGAGIMLVSTLVQSKKALSDSDDIKAVVTTTVATTIDSDGNVVTIAPTEEEELEHNFDVMKYYKDINEDVVGYLQLEGCDIYQPVVQGEDNDYYLTHTYYKGTNKAGSIFMDYRCRVEEDYVSPNIVLYGHNQEDGTMFGNLKDYKQDVDFYAENPIITFNTEYGVGKYVIYAYFVTNALARQDSNGEVFHYHDYIETMNDEFTFNWYLKEVYDRTQIITPVDVEYGDRLLCLSTCSNEFSNSRFVVFARKLREDESPEDFDFTEAYINYNAKGVDWDAIMSAETTSEVETEETTAKKVTGSAITDADGVTLTDENGKKITIRGRKVKDENGEYVTDENGSNITTFGIPVFDENGALVTNSKGAPVTSLPTSEEAEETTAVAETEPPVTEVPEEKATSEKYSKTTRKSKRVDQTKKPATLPPASEEDTDTLITDENGEAVTAVPETSAEETVTETAGADS